MQDRRVRTGFRVADLAMVQVDLANEATPAARVIDGILHFLVFTIIPRKQILVAYFDFPAIPDDVDAVVGLVEIALDTDPSLHPALSFYDLTVYAAGGALILVLAKYAHAVAAIPPGCQRNIKALNGTNHRAIGQVDLPRLIPHTWPQRRDPGATKG